MRFGWRFKFAAGVRVGSSGVRVGPRAAGVRVGPKSSSVTGGVGPLYYSQPVGRRRKSAGNPCAIGCVGLFALGLLTWAAILPPELASPQFTGSGAWYAVYGVYAVAIGLAMWYFAKRAQQRRAATSTRHTPPEPAPIVSQDGFVSGSSTDLPGGMTEHRAPVVARSRGAQ
jgi:hypothetical protein